MLLNLNILFMLLLSPSTLPVYSLPLSPMNLFYHNQYQPQSALPQQNMLFPASPQTEQSAMTPAQDRMDTESGSPSSTTLGSFSFPPPMLMPVFKPVAPYQPSVRTVRKARPCSKCSKGQGKSTQTQFKPLQVNQEPAEQLLFAASFPPPVTTYANWNQNQNEMPGSITVNPPFLVPNYETFLAEQTKQMTQVVGQGYPMSFQVPILNSHISTENVAPTYPYQFGQQGHMMPIPNFPQGNHQMISSQPNMQTSVPPYFSYQPVGQSYPISYPGPNRFQIQQQSVPIKMAPLMMQPVTLPPVNVPAPGTEHVPTETSPESGEEEVETTESTTADSTSTTGEEIAAASSPLEVYNIDTAVVNQTTTTTPLPPTPTDPRPLVLGATESMARAEEAKEARSTPSPQYGPRYASTYGSHNTHNSIEKFDHVITADGYNVEFQSDKGIKSKEEGHLKAVPVSHDNRIDTNYERSTIYSPASESTTGVVHVKTGEVTWTSPECTTFTLKYIADENGYRPSITESAASDCLKYSKSFDKYDSQSSDVSLAKTLLDMLRRILAN